MLPRPCAPATACLIHILVVPGAFAGVSVCNLQAPENCQIPDQQGHGVDENFLVISDTNPIAGFAVADTFAPAADGDITQVCWWGAYAEIGGAGNDCGPGGGDAFTITYYDMSNQGLFPGTVRAGPFDAVNVSKALTGLDYLGRLPEWQFSASHAAVSVDAGESLWIEIRNATVGSCAWLWATAPPGDGVAAQEDDGDGYDAGDVSDYDLAWCLDVAVEQQRPGCGEPGSGDCLVANGTPGCEDEACCQAVCSFDAFCCSVDWDEVCVNEATTQEDCVVLNNDCASRLEITDGLVPFTTVGTTTDGPDYGAGFCGEFGDGILYNDIWFNYTAPCTGILQLTTCNDLGATANFDTRIAVHDGCGVSPDCPADAALSCNDDAPTACGATAFQSTLLVPATAGNCYKIRLGGFSADDSGEGTLGVTCQNLLDCNTVADCADLDGDFVRDSGCVWWACEQGACVATLVPYGDMGGLNGACPPDQLTDGGDFFHALNCFADVDTPGPPTVYPCELNPPFAYNVDVAGPSAPCAPDGLCDGSDFFAALNAFGGTTTCTCDAGPAPSLPATPSTPRTPEAVIRLAGRKARPRAGHVFDVDVYLESALPDLRGYQLHVNTAGGRRGRVELVDMIVEDRADVLFAGLAPRRAFNLHAEQLFVGLESGSIETTAWSYMATLRFRAGREAEGTFTIAVMTNTRDPSQRSFMFNHAGTAIDTPASEPIMVMISRESR